MRKKGILSLILVLLFGNMAFPQEMSDLYKYVIEDYYNVSLEEKYLLEQDTMYLVWCFYDCAESCINYDIQLSNDKIQFKMPKIDCNYVSASVCKLNMPELEGQFIQISISPYRVTYREEDEGAGIIYGGSIMYFFKYDKKKSMYIFNSKKEYGL